jgi:hypothetical protein
MRNIASRLTRIEQRHEANREMMITMYDGAPMTPDEVDRYNASCGPDQPFIFTLRIERASGQSGACREG